MPSKPDIHAEVAAMDCLPREELVDRWQNIYGTPPPKGVRQDLLVRAAAWHLQVKRLGGLSAATRRLLRSAIVRIESEMLARGKEADKASVEEGKADVGDDGEIVVWDSAQAARSGVSAMPSARPAKRQRRRVTPGARLLREWNGKTHVVDVIEGGYVFEAKVYPSLTAIAGQITGVHWSGPRFFGL